MSRPYPKSETACHHYFFCPNSWQEGRLEKFTQELAPLLQKHQDKKKEY